MKKPSVIVFNRTPDLVPKTEMPPAIMGRRRRIVRLYLTAMLLLSLMFSLYIWQSTKIVEIQFRIQELARRTEFLQTNNGVQKAEISQLQSLARIEKVAKTDLGMVVPKKLCYIPMPKNP